MYQCVDRVSINVPFDNQLIYSFKLRVVQLQIVYAVSYGGYFLKFILL